MGIQGAWSNQPVVAAVIIIESGPAGTGLFVYSGTPAPGNEPVLSIAAPGVTTDPFGNPVQPILTIGQLSGSHVEAGTDGTLSLVNAAGVTVITLHPSSGKLQFFDTASGVQKMLIQENSISGESVGTLTVSSGVSGTVGDIALGLLLASQDEAGSQPQLLVGPGTPSALSTAMLEVQGSAVIQGSADLGLLIVSQTEAAPSEPSLQVIASGSGDNALGIMAAADTNFRWKFTPTKLQAGSGSAGLDTSFYRATAGALWGSDPIAANVAGAVETWHAVSFASSGLTGTLRVKLLPLANFAVIDGTIAVTLGAAATTYTFGSLPSSAYYPAAGRQYPVSVTNTPTGITANLPRIFVPSSGAVQMVMPSGSGAATASFTQMIPLD